MYETVLANEVSKRTYANGIPQLDETFHNKEYCYYLMSNDFACKQCSCVFITGGGLPNMRNEQIMKFNRLSVTFYTCNMIGDAEVLPTVLVYARHNK